MILTNYGDPKSPKSRLGLVLNGASNPLDTNHLLNGMILQVQR